MMSASCRAYSLLELLMTLALAAVLFSVGLPSLGALAADKRLRAESDALFHAIHLARKYSVTRRRAITLCPSADFANCRGDGDWSAGWMLYEEQTVASTGTREPSEPVLEFHAVAKNVTIQANRRSFSFRSTHLRATNGTLLVCDRSDRGMPRAVVVSYTGRPRVAREDSRGRPYKCALR